MTLTCATARSQPGSRGVVRVNEVQTGTASSAADEFVELSNTGGTAADIGGWKVVYRSASGTSDTTLATIPAGTTLAPGGFYLLGGSAYAGAATADQSFSPGLAGTGGGVGIRDASGALVDSVGWGTAAERPRRGVAGGRAARDRGSRVEHRPDPRRPRHERERGRLHRDLDGDAERARTSERRRCDWIRAWPTRSCAQATRPGRSGPPIGDGAVRHTLDVTTATGITESRARMWRLLPGAPRAPPRGARPGGGLLVVSGTLTMLLGDPPERVEVAAGEIVAVQPGTGIQMHNTGDADAVVFAYGAPPVTGQVDYLDDVAL